MIRGQEYQLSRLTLDKIAKLEKAIIAKRPDPFIVVKERYSELNKIDPSAGRALVEIAYGDVRRHESVDLSDIFAYLSTREGMAQALKLALEESRPDVTDEALDSLFDTFTVGDMLDMVEILKTTITSAPKQPGRTGDQTTNLRETDQFGDNGSTGEHFSGLLSSAASTTSESAA